MEDLKQTYPDSLPYHQGGKIEVIARTKLDNEHDLSLAYSPGVAVPCKEIQRNPNTAYEYTAKSNLVAVISNGTAVLGLGDIGALAGKPVMEGKAVLFKKFADINAFDIEVDETDPDKFIDIVRAIAPTFGGINLEDIKAPECFYIESRLKEILNIPIMHDDQHGTAIISASGIINGAKVTNKNIADLKVVVLGAGGAAIACAKIAQSLGIKNIVMFDSKGAITTHRKDNLNGFKKDFIVDREINSYKDALDGADVVLGLSRADILEAKDIEGMNPNPMIFVMSNPVPEISPELVRKVRPDAIIATGRSDYPNQINNVLGFPYIFKGALKARARCINEEMKLAAAKALADLARAEIPSDLKQELEKIHGRAFEFGKEYIIPSPFDTRLKEFISNAVAQAAIDSGVARIKSL
ncbi:malic enzyme-like NAD(P)-binding protein [Helicobacter winghamensis]|uniref:Malate dehydrogenase n=1 Tax=Helicobacter winghamensis TaxID=157268 RepID=A0A2N3PII3_9HELI|nr:malic enzyme-like NAD(P)-binding protein [Helicobacter winghamensis]EEO25614.1 putative malate dehydrogenase (oxaloacetate-decarboxylating) (NADP(+)) [Helicobacter winghamensis ATCC BAA-430]PKT76117.1 malate dehydrogenase [Helicobacter winghamensis]PKT76752.1 malate dehydrogenase [Helicobacter winghamensis]PKT76873.1 malate dehydrogenase [Helicobacter winghamensis]PKT80628.1 malate dehydrogenase [Helicobacter winghamensis]